MTKKEKIFWFTIGTILLWSNIIWLLKAIYTNHLSFEIIFHIVLLFCGISMIIYGKKRISDNISFTLLPY